MDKLSEEKKICFIFCVNNENEYNKALEYINKLDVPDGYDIEIIPIRNAESMCSGYNSALKKTKAKYKVYLHQNVCILNKKFLFDVIDLFEKNAELGMLGVAGAAKLPKSGVWWKSREPYGKVLQNRRGKFSVLKWWEVKGEYKTVDAIDGLIMITQYDVAWREDVFKKWHFYDISQCMEFKKAGYKVGIPKQIDPWCEHDWSLPGQDKGNYEEERKLFLQEYGNYL